ncbi:ATP-binding protein [Paratractidigestivibacter sp.]|uniref:ATP-binding protein n=1 Tax=Paratractidigestivibacter sp. TaxID=2847316 RepID=UPI002AC9BF3F|nr:ATP-binding protein [Paratractidigestivibacter sp.]
MSEGFNNPFTPVVGKVPLYMAGRETIIDDVDTALRGNGNDPAIISLLVGARGTGKTALLSHFADTAESVGWVTARVTCLSGMLDDILVRARRGASHLVDTQSHRKVKSLGLKDLATVELEDSKPELTNWRAQVEDILEALAEHETGLLITVDEVTPNVKEMTTLVAACQHFLDEGKKVALIIAGLPYGVTSLLSGESTPFLRRTARFELEPLNDYEVEEALIRTMADGGKKFAPDALAAAVEAVYGFPFMLQLVGYRAWRIAGGASTVDLDCVTGAVDIARKELEQRVYDAVWFELSDADKAFLAAMAEGSGPVRQAELAGRLGKASGHVSRYKKRLLQQGVIKERSRGVLEFCLPGFREYFAERIAEERDL